MGLDMYLSANKYVGAWSHSSDEDKETYRKIVNLLGLKDCKCEESPHLTVSINVGYWRKANSIHNWFVQHCQNGVDECQEAHVTRDQLKELKELCEKVLSHQNKDDAAKAVDELLPPCGGFFFGTTEVTEWYWGDLENTVDIIQRLLDEPKLEGATFTYQSSW